MRYSVTSDVRCDERNVTSLDDGEDELSEISTEILHCLGEILFTRTVSL